MGRLGIVYADPIRLTIVSELNMREMSPPQFFEEFGGTSVDMVRWHFKKLAEHGWLRKVRTAKPSGVPGRPQNFYRATEVAAIDTETWATLPLPIRSALSGRTLEQLSNKIGEALSANTLNSRPDRHLTWTPIILDEQGWKERGQSLVDCFHGFQHEQDDAKVRLQESDEEPVLMTVALAGFESPGILDHRRWRENAPDSPPGSADRPQSPESPVPLTMRLAKVFADPLNLEILTELNLAPMSATQLQAKIGGASVYAFDRRCKMLTTLGWLTKVGSKTGGKRRGAKEIFYRATGPAYLETGVWKSVPPDVKHDVTWTTLQQFWEKVTEAIDAKTFDRRSDRHLTWIPLLLDQRGWDQVISILEAFFRSQFPAQKAAEQRLTQSGEQGFVATFFLAGFESPRRGG